MVRVRTPTLEGYTHAHSRAPIRKRASGVRGGRGGAQGSTSGRARSFARGTEGQRRPSPFLGGALGWIISSPLARTGVSGTGRVCSSPEWWLDGVHVTTPPVPFLWYRSQGLTPLSDSLHFRPRLRGETGISLGLGPDREYVVSLRPTNNRSKLANTSSI